MTSLQDRSVLIIGATGGLGTQISKQLASAGALLTLHGRDESRLQSLGLNAALVAGDLRHQETATNVVGAAVAAHGHLDGIVIASGVVAFGPVADLADDTLVDLFTINTLAPIRVLQAAIPHLVESNTAGRSPFVLNISAVVAEQPTAGMAAYSASKAALTAFDGAAARELRRMGIRMIDARPPHTETGLANRPIAGTPPRLPNGLDPAAVAERLIAAIVNDELDLASSSFA